MQIGELTAVLGIDSSPLRRAEGDLRSFGSTADSTFSSAMRSAAALAATVLTAAAAYKTLVDVIQTGLRVETMGVVMEQIGKNVGISAKSLEYFRKEVESTGVTGMEAMSALSKAMQLGLNLNEMKEFTTRVRDIAVGARDAEGNLLNTSDTLRRVMGGIQSGQVEVLRQMGVNVRNTDVVYKEFAETLGLNVKQLNDAQRAMAMKNEVMRASIPLAGAAAAADATVGKQIASLPRYVEEAYSSLWKLFSPGMYAGVQALTQGFKDLKTWAENNSLALRLMGQQVGDLVGSLAGAVGGTLKWAAANFELIRALTELYIISKIMTWINGLQLAIRASTTAVVIFTGVTQGLIPILFGAAATTTIYTAGLAGMTTATTTATLAGVALNAMMITLLPAIVAVSAALAIYGAYKSFQGQGDTGQGVGSPGTSTMGDDMWEYVNALEAIPDDPFAGPRESSKTYNKTLQDGKLLWDAFAEWANKQWTWMLDMTGAKDDLAWVQNKIQWIIDTIRATTIWNIAVNFIMGSMPTPAGAGESIPYKGSPTKLKFAEKTMFGGSAPTLGARYSDLDTTKIMQDSIARAEANLSSAKKLGEAGGAGKAGKGAKGGKDPAEAAEASLKSFIETMNQETARGAGDSWAVLDAWYAKQILALDKLAAKGVSVADGKKALDAATASKAMKIEEDFEKWYTGAMGMTTLTQVNEDNRKLASVKGHATEEMKVKEVVAQHAIDRERKTTDTIMGIVSQSLSVRASAAPYLEDQLSLQKQQLEIDIKRGDLQFAEQLRVMKLNREISDGQAAELQGLHALENQAKRYAEARKAWMTEGVVGGLKIASLDSQNTAATWQAEQVSSFLKTAPQQISQQMATSFVDALQGKKTDFEALSYQMANWLIQKQLEGFLTQLLPKAIEGVMTLLGIELPAKQTAAETAAVTLEIGGYNAGVAMVNAAYQAAAILSGQSGGIGGGGFADFLSGIFSSEGGTGLGTGEAGTGAGVFEDLAGILSYHSGGIVRAHSGMAPDEILAILQTGERVLSRGQNADYEKGGSGPPQVNLTINNNAKDTEARAEQGPTGDIIVTIDQLTAQAYSRRGSLFKMINSGGGATKR